MEAPERLYKYMPSEFVDSFLRRGLLLFRNLAYFRQVEEKGRSDLLEGLHMDRPDKDVEIKQVDGPGYYRGRAAVLRSIDQDRLFVFCLSEVHDGSLYAEFQSNRCIEILDVPAFLERCERRVSRQRRFRESGLLQGRVEYYAPRRHVLRDITDPRKIPFFKHEAYAHQREFRLAAALDGGLKQLMRVVSPGFSFEAEVDAGRPNDRKVFIGSIEDICRVHEAQTYAGQHAASDLLSRSRPLG